LPEAPGPMDTKYDVEATAVIRRTGAWSIHLGPRGVLTRDPLFLLLTREFSSVHITVETQSSIHLWIC